MIYANVTSLMHREGAPLTHNKPWRDEIVNPIRRPILDCVIPIRPITNKHQPQHQPQPSTRFAREDSGIETGEAGRIRGVGAVGAAGELEMDGMERDTNSQLLCGTKEILGIVVVPATPTLTKGGKEGKKRGDITGAMTFLHCSRAEEGEEEV